MLLNQRQAIDARLKQYHGQGTVRSAAPGTTFTCWPTTPSMILIPRSNANFWSPPSPTKPRNALNLPSSATNANGKANQESAEEHGVNFYRNRITALRRRHPLEAADYRCPWPLHPPRPTARGTLTADRRWQRNPTHTDRDRRVRVQFPWQRGSRSASRHEHPTRADAEGTPWGPRCRSLGVWLRVMTPVAGGNWGGHLVPRPGQEVLVAFQNGNINRPLIIGTAYNGSGQHRCPRQPAR